MSLFSAVEMAPRDPILGLNEAFNADTRPNKVNLGVGVYYNEEGRIPLLRAVVEAEHARIAVGLDAQGLVAQRRRQWPAAAPARQCRDRSAKLQLSPASMTATASPQRAPAAATAWGMVWGNGRSMAQSTGK